jgi:transposase
MEKMSQKQWKRLDIVKRVEAGRLAVWEAAQILGISERQLLEIRKRVRREGSKGVVHGLTGRSPANRSAEEVRVRIVELRRGKYDGFNDQHFTEKLVGEGIAVSRQSVQRILRAAGIGPARRRRPPKHRRRRDRKAQAGQLILWDGSRHDWLEGRGPMLCLMAAIDDATGELLPGAHFVEQECGAGYLRVLLAICKDKGVPSSAYMDRHSSLKRNDDHWTLEEELRGEQEPTQVGRALKKLEVEPIYALSPQAKGRVERLWGTLQDRLVSELRLAGASTIEEANAVLDRYRSDHNRRFTVEPRDSQPAWHKVRASLDLLRVCSFYYEATVLNDNTVRLSNHVIDIPPGPKRRSYARAHVEVRRLLDGSWRVYFKDTLIAEVPCTGVVEEPRQLRHRKRPAATRAFRNAVNQIASSLP